MSADEFTLIERYFRQPAEAAGASSGIVLGIGDDAAVSQTPAGFQLVQTLDTLVGGRHFPHNASARDVGYKALAVNVSDLAAMAADPWTFLLSLTLPASDEGFIRAFSEGLFEAAQDYSIQLIGGDTCRGDLAISIQANGLVPDSRFVTRAGARIGDKIVVSGELGLGALGLALEMRRIELPEQTATASRDALHRPRARTDLISILRAHASSAIDISDGLVADLGHVLEQSGVGAHLWRESLPLPDWVRQNGWEARAIAGGDDYQLVFTVAAARIEQVLQEATRQEIELTVIGEIVDAGYRLVGADETDIDLRNAPEFSGGYNHFGA